jgi:diguanylate cyclase (GGDEF)-like protein
VLLALSTYVILATLQNTRATRSQAQVLAVDALFAEARTSIALQEVHLRHYQVEPSVAVRGRFAGDANSAVAALGRVAATGHTVGARDADRLRGEQLQYRRLAIQLIAMITDRDPRHRQHDRVEVTPAYYTLQHDIDKVARAFHADAERQVAAQRAAQKRMLVNTAVGFGLALVAMIWRMVLGYQRRLIAHADASQRQALHDPLTGLPNRVLFADRILGLGRGVARRPAPLALMIIDLNGFKAVNDSLGHAAGDELLVEVAGRLSLVARRGDLVARIGGDEFAVLLPDVSDLGTIRQVAERLADTLRHDFFLADGPAAVSGSIGVAMSPLHGDATALQRHADAAMYRAKANGGGVAIYDPRLDAELPDRMTLFAELRALLDAGNPDGQLLLYYQPQVRLRDGTVTAVEALVRWQHPERGLLQPADFLPIAETRGLEVPLTYYLLGVAVRQAAIWRREGRPLTVAVNISPRCLLDDDLVGQVRRTLEEHGLPPGHLRLEVTETSIMADPERTLAAVREVHAYGVRISVDDFGTGFSSLAQLRLLPADELKIDKTFILDLRPDSEDELVVRSAVELAHNMGLSVVAEGVERLPVLARLSELACDYAQGFALSRPVPVDEVAAACRRAQQIARSAAARRVNREPAVG